MHDVQRPRQRRWKALMWAAVAALLGCSADVGTVDGGVIATCGDGICSVEGCAPLRGDCNKKPEDGCETDIGSDPRNCGGCGTVCPGAAQGEATCSLGACSTCPRGFADCDKDPSNGCEANLTSSPDQCGSCGATCPAVPNGQRGCISGKCGVKSCTSTFRDCNGDATDGCESNVEADPRNCGSCSKVCAGVENGVAECKSGSCGLSSCTAPYRSCKGGPVIACETNVSLDVANCGYCGNDCAGPNKNLPVQGFATCREGVCAVGSCKDGFQDCNEKYSDGCEINTKTDVNNCGACGNKCAAPANGAAGCVNGKCVITRCSDGFADCDQSFETGCESDLLNGRPSACGTCGNLCGPAHATPLCRVGKCGFQTCDPGWGNCDANEANGCETQTATSTDHCLACGNKCQASTNVASVLEYVCKAGGCAIERCAAGRADCDGNYANGCETNTTNDTLNCGGCNKSCLPEQNAGVSVAQCVNSACALSCAASTQSCDGVQSNGCEINTSNDVNNCGACGRGCVSGTNPTTVKSYGCSSSLCNIAECNGAFRNCDNGFNNGCEIDTASNPLHCGACFNRCDDKVVFRFGLDRTTCTAGNCGIICQRERADCDAQIFNGCETPLATLNNCLSCGDRCEVLTNADRVLDFRCRPDAGCTVEACRPPFGDCDQKIANGCETDTDFNVSHCGGCNRPCTVTANQNSVNDIKCIQSRCEIRCAPNQLNCDNEIANGCEVDRRTNVNNCGECGNACLLPDSAVTQSCTDARCKIETCKNNLRDCDGSFLTGCEVNITNDLGNCGACGNACALPATATSRTCTNSKCKVEACKTDLRDCNGVFADGCEIDVSKDASNCGTCGNACPMDKPTCSAGVCIK